MRAALAPAGSTLLPPSLKRWARPATAALAALRAPLPSAAAARTPVAPLLAPLCARAFAVAAARATAPPSTAPGVAQSVSPLPPGAPQVVIPAPSLTEPQKWYPRARSMKRRIIAHLGPTNSGKTHRALAALKAASSGVYCGPLRLLAWENFDRMNAEGTPTSLITGQERELVEGAAHVSCTVEMVSINTPYEVVVLDEIQMISDAERGSAWSRCLLGARAEEIHVCGDPATLPLLERLVALTGDELQVHHYSRLSPLRVSEGPLTSLSDIKPGDCLVAFSRRDLFTYKRAIEGETGLRVGIVYGSLPPVVRREQARRFNAWPTVHAKLAAAGHRTALKKGAAASASAAAAAAVARSGVSTVSISASLSSSSTSVLDGPSSSSSFTHSDVLVATDAIGMGLNLTIGRVIFSRVDKFDGVQRRPLTISEMKQIGGRAGRFNGPFAGVGEVSALGRAALASLRTAIMHKDSPPLPAAAVAPTVAQLERFAAGLIEGWKPAPRGGRGKDCSETAGGGDVDGAGNVLSRWLEDAGAGQGAGDADRVAHELGHEEAEPDSDPEDAAWDLGPEGEGGGVGLGVARGKSAPSLRPARSSDRHLPSSGGFSLAFDDEEEMEDDGEFEAGADCSDDLLGGGEVDDFEAVLLGSSGKKTSAPASSSSSPAIVVSELSRRQAANLAASLMPFSEILTAFCDCTLVDRSLFALGDPRDAVDIARLTDDIAGLAFRVRYRLTLAPVKTDDPLCRTVLRRYASKLVQGGSVPIGVRVPTSPPRTPAELSELESVHAAYDLYLWLAQRYPQRFPHAEAAREAAGKTQALIQAGLDLLGDKAAAASKRAKSKGSSGRERGKEGRQQAREEGRRERGGGHGKKHEGRAKEQEPLW